MNDATLVAPHSNDAALDSIINAIFQITNPKIAETRREEIRSFIKTTVNGDEIKAYLPTDANLKDRRGILVYILTNRRLIKVEIDDKEITSAFYFLTAMTGVERKLVEGNKASVQVSFQNGSMGLRYSATNQTITEFFQKVEQVRSDGANPNG